MNIGTAQDIALISVAAVIAIMWITAKAWDEIADEME